MTTLLELPPLRDTTDPGWWHVARHEAGHAVMATYLRRPFQHVTLRSPRPTVRGEVVGLDMKTKPIGSIAIYLAGAAAEPDDSAVGSWCVQPGSTTDLNNATKKADGLDDIAIQALVNRVFNLVRGTHAEAVDAVAHALLHHPEQQLTHRQVADLVDDHAPGGLTWTIRRAREHLAHTGRDHTRRPQ